MIENVVHKIKVLWVLEKIIRERRVVRVPNFRVVNSLLWNVDVNIRTPTIMVTIEYTTTSDGDVPVRSVKVAERDCEVRHIRQFNAVIAGPPS